MQRPETGRRRGAQGTVVLRRRKRGRGRRGRMDRRGEEEEDKRSKLQLKFINLCWIGFNWLRMWSNSNVSTSELLWNEITYWPDLIVTSSEWRRVPYITAGHTMLPCRHDTFLSIRCGSSRYLHVPRPTFGNGCMFSTIYNYGHISVPPWRVTRSNIIRTFH